jgi:hypothetical protein
MFPRRVNSLHVSFEAQTQAAATPVCLTRRLSVQIVFLLLGLVVLQFWIKKRLVANHLVARVGAG